MLGVTIVSNLTWFKALWTHDLQLLKRIVSMQINCLHLSSGLHQVIVMVMNVCSNY